jgi:FkbM family methyltransferase
MGRILLKRFASKLPDSWQMEMKRYLYRKQIRRDTFITDEPEYALLGSFLSCGDWAIDVGANIGHYTKRMSDLVGARGRVLAFEPVAATFSLLAANTQSYNHQNVTLLNVAVSDTSAVAGISIPQFFTGLPNYYEATINPGNDGLKVLTVSIDSLRLPHSVRLVKIDAEGHEPFVLDGMKELLARDKPILIVEVSNAEVHSLLESKGYSRKRLENSPNHIYQASD